MDDFVINLPSLHEAPTSPNSPRDLMPKVLDELTLEECIGMLPDTVNLAETSQSNSQLTSPSLDPLRALDLDEIVPLVPASPPSFRPLKERLHTSPLSRSAAAITPDSTQPKRTRTWYSEQAGEQPLAARKSARSKTATPAELKVCHADLQAVLCSGRLDTKKAMAMHHLMQCLAMDELSVKKLPRKQRDLVGSIRAKALTKHQEAAKALAKVPTAKVIEEVA